MTRQRTRRPAPNWTESVVLRSSEGPLSDPDPMAQAEHEMPADRALTTRVIPAWLVAAALLLACAASVATALWWQQRSRIIEVTERVQPYYSAGPDAAGCPTLSRCQVKADVGQPLNVLARQLFPAATVLSSLSTVLSDTGQTVQTSIVLDDPSGIEVSAVAQCVPGAGPIPGRAAPLPAAGPAQADFVVAGSPGCSVAVSAQIPRAVAVPVTQLQTLVTDPGVQLQR
jgi:hypothetical protein